MKKWSMIVCAFALLVTSQAFARNTSDENDYGIRKKLSEINLAGANCAHEGLKQVEEARREVSLGSDPVVDRAHN